MENDLLTWFVTVVDAVITMKTIELFNTLGLVSSNSSRKLVWLQQLLLIFKTHICMGIVYVLHWRYFSDHPSGRYYAASIPSLLTIGIVLVGFGLRKVVIGWPLRLIFRMKRW
jgi:hypothetical protein